MRCEPSAGSALYQVAREKGASLSVGLAASVCHLKGFPESNVQPMGPKPGITQRSRYHQSLASPGILLRYILNWSITGAKRYTTVNHPAWRSVRSSRKNKKQNMTNAAEALLVSLYPTPRITTILTSNTIDAFCLFSHLIQMESYSTCLFVSGLFCSTYACEIQPCHRVWQWFINSRGYIAFCRVDRPQFIYLSRLLYIGIWVFPGLGLLLVVLLWTFLYVTFGEQVFVFLLGTYPREEILDYSRETV